MSGGMGFRVVEQQCKTEGCEEMLSGWGMKDRCGVHALLHDAAWLSPEDLARVQAEIGEVTSITPKERRRIRRQSDLRMVEMEAQTAARYAGRARANGATPAQVAAAQRRGAERAVQA